MSNKFNSKYAADVTETSFSPSDPELEQAGISATPTNTYNSRELEEPEGRPKFTQLETTTREEVSRPPLVYYGPDKNMDPEDRIERIKTDPEAFAEKEKAFHQRSQRTPEQRSRMSRFRQNISDRHTIKAVFAAIDRSARELYPCPECGGAFNGGKPVLPTERRHEREFCQTCANTGHTIISPETGFFDLERKAAIHNAHVSFHNKWCNQTKCHKNCGLNKTGLVDQLRRQHIDSEDSRFNEEAAVLKREKGRDLKPEEVAQIAPREPLQRKHTHAEPGAAENVIETVGPVALIDHFKPMTSAHLLGGREHSDITMDDHVLITNYDTTNPNASITSNEKEKMFETYRPSQWGATDTSKEQEENGKSHKNRFFKIPFTRRPIRDESVRVKGFTDPQTTGIVTGLSADGRSAKVVEFGTPSDVRIEERNTRMNGRPDKVIRNNTMEAINDTNEPAKKPEDTEKNAKRSKFKQQVAYLYSKIAPLRTERSPVEKREAAVSYHPVENLARMSDITYPLVATVGHTHEKVARKDLKISTNNQFYSKSKIVTAKVIRRKGLGHSPEEIRDTISNTINNEARRELKRWGTRTNKVLGISRNDPESLLPHETGAEISEQSGAPKRRKFSPPKKSVSPGDLFSIGESGASIPMAELPPEINPVNSEEGINEAIDVVRKGLGGRELTPEEHATARNNIKQRGHINGALDDDYEEDDDE